MTDHSAPAPAHTTTVRQRIVRGLGANAFGQLVTVIVQLVGVPILLHAWGVQLYGEWLILFAIPAYLAVTDLGFSQAVGNEMTARMGRGDRAGALKAYQSLLALVYSLSGLGVLLVGLLLWQLPIHSWLNFGQLSTGTADWILWFFAAQVFVGLLDGVNHAGFRASGEYALHVGLNSVVRLLQFSSIWIAALAGLGPLAAAGAFFAVQAVAIAGLTWLLLRRHVWLSFGIKHASWGELRPLLKPSIANLTIPLAQALNIQGMVLVVGAFLGPYFVVVFTALRTLSRLPLQLILAISHAIQPELEIARGASDTRLLKTLYVNALSALFLLASLTALVLAIVGDWILRAWTRGEVQMNSELFFLLLAASVCGVFWYGALGVLKAMQVHLSSAITLVFCSASTVIASACLLSLTNDILFAGLMLLIQEIIIAGYVLRQAAKALRLSTGEILVSAVSTFPQLIRWARLILMRKKLKAREETNA